MDYDNGFILQKTVDWSLLNDGMTSIIIKTPYTSTARSSCSSLRMARC